MQLAVDASPIIHLASCDQLDLLPALAAEVAIPEAVLQELEAGADRDEAAQRVKRASWARIVKPEPPPADLAVWDLGAGETAVLSWVLSRSGWTVVADDRAARSCARTLGLPFVGTLGVVLAAKEAGHVPAARPIFEEMIRAGYHLSTDVLEAALRGVGE